MKLLFLTLAVTFSITNAGKNISCFQCEGSEKTCNKFSFHSNEDKYLRVCKGDTDRCMRVWQAIDKESIVQNTCSNERLCNKLFNACIKLRRQHGHRCAVGCCLDDACNLADPGMYFSPPLFILCIVVGVIQTLKFT